MNSLLTRIAFIVAFVTVSFGVNAQSINSTLNNRPGVVENGEELFEVNLSPGAISPMTNVKLAIVLDNPAQSANIDLYLQNPQTSVYEQLIFDVSGNSISAPGPYLFLSTYNAKVTFTAPGVYDYSLQILDGTTNAVLANSDESVTVLALPSISSTLPGMSPFITGTTVDYSVSTVANDFAGTMVRVFFELSNPAQAANLALQYEATPGNFLPLTINGAGQGYFGPVSGFPLSSTSTNFKATASAAGTYEYTMSVYDVATNDTLASTTESILVVDPTPPTIFSSIAGDTLTTGVQEQYTVSTTTGDFAGTMVKVFFKMDPAQVGNGTVEYFETQNSTWYPFPVNGNGEATFGPSTGFPLANTSSLFRVTYSVPGVYTSKMAIIKAANPSDTLAIANEFVVVEDPLLPTIASTLPSFSPALTGSTVDYSVATVANDYAGTMVRVFFELSNPAQATNLALQYEATPGNFLPLPINGAGQGYFGPASGFPLASTSTNFKATANAAGTYEYKMSVYDVATNDTLASAVESIVVVDPVLPTISSTLPSFSPEFTGTTVDYTVSTVANDYAGTMVRVFFELSNPAQATDINIEYEATPGNFLPLAINGAGQGFFGPVAGFPLADASSNFKATATAAGVYEYKMSLYDVATNDTLATAVESITVVDYVAPTISSDLDGLTVFTNATTDYQVTTTPGSEAGTMVKGFFRLLDPSQTNDVNITYDDGTGTFLPLTIAPNGTGEFGPASGFPLSALSSDFKVIFDAAGIYDYKISIYSVASGDTLASSTESVTVVDPIAPTISSTLPSFSPEFTGTTVDYTVSTVANDYAGTMVRVFFELSNPAQAADINIEYEATPGNFLPLAINGAGQGFFGPVAGFPLADASSNFKATATAAGVYEYKMSLYDVATNDTLTSAVESIVVVDPVLPTISSTLPSFSPEFTGTTVDYTVSTVANDYAGTMVRIFFELSNPAQAADINIEYEATPGNFLPLAINGAGQGFFGPVAGFPLADASSNFKATATAAGVYEYKMSLYDVATNDTLASAVESITVVDYVAPTISSDLDGLTVTTGDETPYQVTTTAGSEAGTMVKGFFRLLDPSQANDVNITYDDGTGTFLPLTIAPNGTGEFGPASGFPLSALSSDFKVIFDAAGIYDYKISIYSVASGDTLASSTESVTVVDPIPVDPEIYSDLDGRLNVSVNNEEAFTVTTVKNDGPNTNVRIQITLANPAQADSIDLSFENPATSTFEQLIFDANGITYAGNTSGFPLADEDYNFKISFIGGGLYQYNLALVDANTNTVLADNDEEVYVLDDASINENNTLISNVFPNPTTGFVTLQTLASGKGTVDVVDITGKKVMSQTITGSVNQIDLTTLTNGVYIIRISQDGTMATIRVVKQ